jgi:hypothetical protein
MFLHFVGLLGRGLARRKAAIYTGQQTQTQTYIRAPTVIRTHDQSGREVEDGIQVSSMLRAQHTAAEPGLAKV